VAGAGRGLDTEALDGVQDDQAEGQRGELGVAGLGQLVGTGVEEQVLQVPARHLGGVGDHVPRRVVLPRLTHSGAL